MLVNQTMPLTLLVPVFGILFGGFPNHIKGGGFDLFQGFVGTLTGGLAPNRAARRANRRSSKLRSSLQWALA